MPRGFASLSKDRLRQLSQKGGRRAHVGRSGVHTYNRHEAILAGQRGNDRKRAEAGERARERLIGYGFTPEQLTQLTLDGLIFFGGAKTSQSKRDRLKAALAGESVEM